MIRTAISWLKNQGLTSTTSSPSSHTASNTVRKAMFPPAVTISENRSTSIPFSAASRAAMRSRSSGIPCSCW